VTSQPLSEGLGSSPNRPRNTDPEPPRLFSPASSFETTHPWHRNQSPYHDSRSISSPFGSFLFGLVVWFLGLFCFSFLVFSAEGVGRRVFFFFFFSYPAFPPPPVGSSQRNATSLPGVGFLRSGQVGIPFLYGISFSCRIARVSQVPKNSLLRELLSPPSVRKNSAFAGPSSTELSRGHSPSLGDFCPELPAPLVWGADPVLLSS